MKYVNFRTFLVFSWIMYSEFYTTTAQLKTIDTGTAAYSSRYHESEAIAEN